jgi:hypothetical protein
MFGMQESGKGVQNCDSDKDIGGRNNDNNRQDSGDGRGDTEQEDD